MTFTYPSHTTKGCVPLSSDVTERALRKNASPRVDDVFPTQDGKRFAFQVVWIVTLRKGLFKCSAEEAAQVLHHDTLHTTAHGKNDFCMLVPPVSAATFHNYKIVALIFSHHNDALRIISFPERFNTII